MVHDLPIPICVQLHELHEQSSTKPPLESCLPEDIVHYSCILGKLIRRMCIRRWQIFDLGSPLMLAAVRPKWWLLQKQKGKGKGKGKVLGRSPNSSVTVIPPYTKAPPKHSMARG